MSGVHCLHPLATRSPYPQFLLVRLLICDIVFTLLCRNSIAIILYYSLHQLCVVIVA